MSEAAACCPEKAPLSDLLSLPFTTPPQNTSKPFLIKRYHEQLQRFVRWDGSLAPKERITAWCESHKVPLSLALQYLKGRRSHVKRTMIPNLPWSVEKNRMADIVRKEVDKMDLVDAGLRKVANQRNGDKYLGMLVERKPTLAVIQRQYTVHLTNYMRMKSSARARWQKTLRRETDRLRWTGIVTFERRGAASLVKHGLVPLLPGVEKRCVRMILFDLCDVVYIECLRVREEVRKKLISSTPAEVERFYFPGETEEDSDEGYSCLYESEFAYVADLEYCD